MADKLAESLRFPTKTSSDQTQRNKIIKANRPPQQYTSRRLVRDWDPVLSCDIESYTRSSQPTKPQADWRASFREYEEINQDRMYAGVRGPQEPLHARKAIGEHIHRTDDDSVPTFAQHHTYQTTYGDRTLSPDQQKDRAAAKFAHDQQSQHMWREQMKYELQLGVETSSNRFAVKGRDRQAGKTPAQKSFEETRPATPQLCVDGMSEQEVMNLPPAYRKQCSSDASISAHLKSQDYCDTPVKPLTPYKETNGMGMNECRRPRDIFYANLEGSQEIRVAQGIEEPEQASIEPVQPELTIEPEKPAEVEAPERSEPQTNSIVAEPLMVPPSFMNPGLTPPYAYGTVYGARSAYGPGPAYARASPYVGPGHYSRPVGFY